MNWDARVYETPLKNPILLTPPSTPKPGSRAWDKIKLYLKPETCGKSGNLKNKLDSKLHFFQSFARFGTDLFAICSMINLFFYHSFVCHKVSLRSHSRGEVRSLDMNYFLLLLFNIWIDKSPTLQFTRDSFQEAQWKFSWWC